MVSEYKVSLKCDQLTGRFNKHKQCETDPYLKNKSTFRTGQYGQASLRLNCNLYTNLSSSFGGLGPFGPKSDFAGRPNGRTNNGLRELDIYRKAIYEYEHDQ